MYIYVLYVYVCEKGWSVLSGSSKTKRTPTKHGKWEVGTAPGLDMTGTECPYDTTK
ncbi:hypothetical protein Hanom_Chr06g00487591 [Helianthus anomalus]